LPAALTLVVRGASSDSEAFMEAFGVAITPYREARYADAATALEGVTRQFPQVAEGWFYLGVARLLSERAGDAVEPLRRARGSEVVGEHARWIEAVALARAGRADEAATALQAMCESRGSHRAGACEALRAGR
jgi:predicted Zn-dependent protease